MRAIFPVGIAIVLVLAGGAFGAFGTYDSGSGSLPTSSGWVANQSWAQGGSDYNNNTQTSIKTDYNDSVWPTHTPTLANVLQTAEKGGGSYSNYSNSLGTATEVSMGASFQVSGARGVPNGSLGGSYGFGNYTHAVNNNNGNPGAALVTLMTQGGPAFDLNVTQDGTDHYWYTISKFDVNSDHAAMTTLGTLGTVDGVGGTGQFDPSWHTIWMYANSATGNIKVSWDGATVLDTNLGTVNTGLGALAIFGSGNVYQQDSNSGARLNAFWQNVTVMEGLNTAVFTQAGKPLLAGAGWDGHAAASSVTSERVRQRVPGSRAGYGARGEDRCL